MSFRCSLLALFYLVLSSLPAFSQSEGDSLINIQFKNFQSAQGEDLIAVHMSNKEEWHTYWQNPGDSGIPITFEFVTNQSDFHAKQKPWPVPTKHIEPGDIWTFGYEGDNTFILHKPAAEQLKGLTQITLKMKWLICKDICIPGGQSVVADIDANQNIQWPADKTYKISDSELQNYLKSLPQTLKPPGHWKFKLTQGTKEEELILHYEHDIKNSLTDDTHHNLVTPFPSPLLGFRHEALFLSQDNKKVLGYTKMDWEGQYQEPEVPFPSTLKLEKPLMLRLLIREGEKNYFTEVEFSEIEPGSQLDSYKNYQTYKADTHLSHSSASNKNYSLMSFLNILFFAFLGGLILNLMPCVLPVISLKLFGLIKYQEENRAKILRHNVFYTLGVISTLMVLSLIIVAIKNTGQNVGWGFQLQSPLFVGVMILVLFVMALNLFGLFEFRTPGGKFFANVNIEDTFWGDFFSGALATILSTPCSAPFLGTALTFAFTASSFEIFITFIFIGLGLAFPFIITAVFPSTVKFLPKPGAWMEKLKYFLGLTLVMTVVWLLDVLHTLVDSQFLIRNFYTLVVSLFFLIFFYNKISKKFLWNLIGTVIVSYLFFSFATNYQKNEPQFVQAAETKEESAWTNFSPELIEDYLQSNELAFIDFTAKWCLTCQVNKKLVLERNSFYELINHRKIKLIRADWTRRDPIIGDWLAERGVVGIPAYYLIKDGELHYLGETISLSEIESFFN